MHSEDDSSIDVIGNKSQIGERPPDHLDENVTHASVLEGLLGKGDKLLQTQVIYKSPEKINLPFELLHYRILLADGKVTSVVLYEISQMGTLNTRQDAGKTFDEIVSAANRVPHIFNSANFPAAVASNMIKIGDNEPLYSIFSLSPYMSSVDFFTQVIWKMHTFPEEVTNRLINTFIITNLPSGTRSFLVRLAFRVTRNTQVVANLREALSLVRGTRP